jgi:hypothetical protein
MLRRLRRYTQKVFRLDAHLASFTDCRQRPRLPLAGIWYHVVLMFMLDYGSVHALEMDLKRQAGRGPKLKGAASARQIARVFTWLSLDDLRALLAVVVATLKRNKVLLAAASSQGLVAAAVDGHEYGASYVRHGDCCLEREVKVKVRVHGQWEVQRRTQYYHQVVVCFLVDCLLPVILDVELRQPGEGEATAARRLLQRVGRQYPRLFDVVTADALYADGAFIRQARAAHKHVVVVVKDERREILQEAARLRHAVRPSVWRDEEGTCTLWDLPGFVSWWRGPKVPLRVVWCEEVSVRPARQGRRGEKKQTRETWVWLTDLAPWQAHARSIWRFGHRRWHIENRCFNDGAAHWGLDHIFHHEPNAMAAYLLTLAVAMILLHAFLERQLKPAARRWWTALSLRRQFFREFGRELTWWQWLRGIAPDSS